MTTLTIDPASAQPAAQAETGDARTAPLLLHPQIAPWCVAKADGLELTLWVRDAHCDHGSAPFVRIEPDNEAALLPMQRQPLDHACLPHWQQWRAHVAWDRANDPMVYCFKLLQQGRQHWLAADGHHASVPPRDVHFRASASLLPPQWVADQVFYQVFPDRFCQGDPTLAVRTDEYVYGNGQTRVVQRPWGEPLDPAQAATTFYGGDLPGIVQRLDYLHGELGITALYLNPIFTSGSNHKYDTDDYDNVDPHLGGNAALVALRQALTARGMRLVLDAVVNHTGLRHAWLSTKPWYSRAADGSLIGWKGHASLPVLDFSVPAVRAAVYAADDAVLRHWLRPPYAADGWRLDVIHMLGEGAGALHNTRHVAAMRAAIKHENPQAYVLGEHFGEASRWLQGDQEDGAMNYYGFLLPLRGWLAGVDMHGHAQTLDAEGFAQALTVARARIGWPQQLAQLNLLDSHDTARLLSLLKGDRARMMLAVTLLFTYPGVPCVYYGDEIGMQGGEDPDCRRCMDWQRDHWDHGLWQHSRDAIARRHARVELRRGAYVVLSAVGQVLCFARFTDAQVTVVMLNAGAALAVPLPLGALPLPGLASGQGWVWDGDLPDAADADADADADAENVVPARLADGAMISLAAGQGRVMMAKRR